MAGLELRGLHRLYSVVKDLSREDFLPTWLGFCNRFQILGRPSTSGSPKFNIHRASIDTARRLDY